MFLKRISLKDWKAYVDATLDFPRPQGNKNVILIGARNGFGKTSLFEALVLGLFGRDGLPLIARAPFGGSADDRLQFSYNTFLADSLHGRALADNRRLASVQLEFETDAGEPLILRRIWHFSADGRHKPADEELRVYRGRDERPEGCPPGEDEVDWRRTYVARNLLPHTLAAFFLFDGEQVQALADRDMSAQVRTGIEGLLGVQVLRELAGDLRKYADNRRYTAGGATSTKFIEKIRNDLFVLEHELNECNQKLGEVRPELDRLTARRDHLTRELSSIGAGGSDATVKERFEELNRVKRALEDLWARLTVQITGEVSLALAGRDLRLRARDRLKQEAVREEWEAGRKQGEAGLERFTGLMAEGMQTMAPPLDQGHRDAVLRLVLESWDALWHPAPAGTAPDFRHEYAKGADRARVLEALERVEHVSNESVLGLLKEIGRRDGERQKLENEIGQLEGISPQIEAKATELRSLNGTIDKLSVERGSLERSHDGISSQLGQKRQELARSTQSFQNAAPKLRLATTADRVAEVIDRIIQQAVPHQIAAVAESMTRAFRAMSHKKIVDRVEIDVNCGVRLLSSSGRDIREMAASAGEQQIFVQALISAISEVSKRNFPIMIDTPLGRLDDQHRFGVLKYFTDRPGQVILLSTDTEVVGPYLDVIKPRLAATYHIRHEHDGDIGRSYIERGYFPETRA